ncbi:MAG: helix-turn-helix transcriptional regulator [archaeon]|nr:helix-turn-helix transcriptional regulator [archaeon]MCP8320607.1 helix-turn-helix transcriptional regulator [archaeon]
MDELEAKAKLSKSVSPEVLADVTRLKIMKALSVGEKPCSELYNNYPNGRKHMEILEKEGIVKKTAKEFYTFYSLAKPEIANILADL